MEKKETKSGDKAKVKKVHKESKEGQKDNAKKITKGKTLRSSKTTKSEGGRIKKEKVTKKKAEHKRIVHEKEEEKAKAVEEKLPVRKAKEILIEKIKFHGKKSLLPDERKNIHFIIAKKKKTPKFLREEMYKVKKLKDVWRRRRGLDSKKAEEKRGKGKSPKIGYKKSGSIAGISPSGYYPILVHNHGELQTLNPVREAAIIASAVGRRKRNEIIKMANDRKIMILNPRKGEIQLK